MTHYGPTDPEKFLFEPDDYLLFNADLIESTARRVATLKDNWKPSDSIFARWLDQRTEDVYQKVVTMEEQRKALQKTHRPPQKYVVAIDKDGSPMSFAVPFNDKQELKEAIKRVKTKIPRETAFKLKSGSKELLQRWYGADKLFFENVLWQWTFDYEPLEAI